MSLPMASRLIRRELLSSLCTPAPFPRISQPHLTGHVTGTITALRNSFGHDAAAARFLSNAFPSREKAERLQKARIQAAQDAAKEFQKYTSGPGSAEGGALGEAGGPVNNNGPGTQKGSNVARRRLRWKRLVGLVTVEAAVALGIASYVWYQSEVFRSWIERRSPGLGGLLATIGHFFWSLWPTVGTRRELIYENDEQAGGGAVSVRFPEVPEPSDAVKGRSNAHETDAQDETAVCEEKGGTGGQSDEPTDIDLGGGVSFGRSPPPEGGRFLAQPAARIDLRENDDREALTQELQKESVVEPDQPGELPVSQKQEPRLDASREQVFGLEPHPNHGLKKSWTDAREDLVNRGGLGGHEPFTDKPRAPFVKAHHEEKGEEVETDEQRRNQDKEHQEKLAKLRYWEDWERRGRPTGRHGMPPAGEGKVAIPDMQVEAGKVGMASPKADRRDESTTSSDDSSSVTAEGSSTRDVCAPSMTTEPSGSSKSLKGDGGEMQPDGTLTEGVPEEIEIDAKALESMVVAPAIVYVPETKEGISQLGGVISDQSISSNRGKHQRLEDQTIDGMMPTNGVVNNRLIDGKILEVMDRSLQLIESKQLQIERLLEQNFEYKLDQLRIELEEHNEAVLIEAEEKIRHDMEEIQKGRQRTERQSFITEKNKLIDELAVIRGKAIGLDETVAQYGERLIGTMERNRQVHSLLAVEKAILEDLPPGEALDELRIALRENEFTKAVFDALPKPVLDHLRENPVVPAPVLLASLEQRLPDLLQSAFIPQTGGLAGHIKAAFCRIVYGLTGYITDVKGCSVSPRCSVQMLVLAAEHGKSGNLDGCYKILKATDGLPRHLILDWLADAEATLTTQLAVAALHAYIRLEDPHCI